MIADRLSWIGTVGVGSRPVVVCLSGSAVLDEGGDGVGEAHGVGERVGGCGDRESR